MKFCLLILTVLPVISWGKEKIFNPIATINSFTIGHGKFSLGRAPLGNINTTFLASSLNFGLFERLEVGTAPLFYSAPEHDQNYNFKLNFYKGDIFNWSVSVGTLNFKAQVTTTDGKQEEAILEMSTVVLATNIHLPDSRYVLGLSAGNSCGKIRSSDIFIFISSFRCVDETGIDLQYEYKKNIWFTFGQGRYREAGLTPYENVVGGYGAAVTMFRKGSFFSRPSVGAYVSENGQNMLLLTTTFYEE